MTLVEIRDKLVEAMHLGWAYPEIEVIYDNAETFDIARAGDAFVKFSILFDTATQANISDQPFHRTYGTVVITVFLKETRGSRLALSYIDELSAVFRFKNLGGVHLQSPRPSKGPSGDGWYSEVLRLSFYADSNT